MAKRKEKIKTTSTVAGRTNYYLRKYFDYICEYESEKVIIVKNIPMGIMRLVLYTIILCYILLDKLWWEHGYQEFSSGASALTTKVKGFST